MKKTILLFLLTVLSLGTFETRADDGFTIQFCNEISNWMHVIQKNKVNYRCYIYIPAEMATQIAGNEITSITFSASTDFETSRQGSIFVTEDLEAAPAASTPCEILDSYTLGNKTGAYYQTVEFDTPYVIKSGTPFYFGYTVETARIARMLGKADFPVGIDNMEANNFAGYVEVTDEDGEILGTLDMAQDVGTNMFLAAKTVGKASGFNDIVMLGNLILSDGEFTLPVVDIDSQSSTYLPIRNFGSNSITSIQYTVDVNGIANEPKTLSVAVEPMSESYIELPTPQLESGRNNITLNVTEVNGKPSVSTSTGTCFAFRKGEGYSRKFVVEEGTGTWCGWCPRGIVGLEKMSEKYPDTFIGIAIHSDDNMYTNSYAPLINAYFTGFPTSIINRDSRYIIDPDFEYLEEAFKTWSGQLSPASVKAQVEAVDEHTLKVCAETVFACDDNDANYALSFVVLEDGIIDSQDNYYAGNPNSLEWWDEQGKKVDWTYQHTARDIFDCFGLNGSMPSKIEAGKVNSYTTTISSRHISDINNTSVVVLLLDVASNTILNATKVEAKDYHEISGIDDVTYDSMPIEYFNLDGTRAGSFSSSIFIKRQGASASKVIQQTK